MKTETDDVTKFIEPRISLTWLLGAVGTIGTLLAVAIWNAALANAQMARVAEAVSRMEARMDTRDARLDALVSDFLIMKGVNEVQNTRIAHLESERAPITRRPPPDYSLGGK